MSIHLYKCIASYSKPLAQKSYQTTNETTKVEDVHFAQAINYLEAYNLEVGLLINFGERSLNFNRLQNKKFVEK